MRQVIRMYDRSVAFEGSADECREWILSQAFEMKDGSRIFRTWTSNGEKHWDVGVIYIFNED